MPNACIGMDTHLFCDLIPTEKQATKTIFSTLSGELISSKIFAKLARVSADLVLSDEPKYTVGMR